jgi:hypothetical protein
VNPKTGQRPRNDLDTLVVQKGKANPESTGDALLRLAKLGKKLQIKAPADLSSRIDDYLYGDE